MRKIFNLSLSLFPSVSLLRSFDLIAFPFFFFSSPLSIIELLSSLSQSRFSLLSTQKNTCTSPLHVVNARTQSLTRLDSSHERESRNPLFEPRLTSLRENTFLLYSLRDISGKRKEEKKRCLFTLSLSLSLIFFLRCEFCLAISTFSLSPHARASKNGVSIFRKEKKRERKFKKISCSSYLYVSLILLEERENQRGKKSIPSDSRNVLVSSCVFPLAVFCVENSIPCACG